MTNKIPFFLGILSLIASIITATPLGNADVSTLSQLLQPANGSIPQLSYPHNITNLDASLDIQCDGPRYGENPDIRDCEGARGYIDPGLDQVTFGERGTGLPKSVFPLPHVVIGDKARCYFQTINIGDGETARASWSQIRSAASALFLKCASTGFPSTGGLVKNIGGDNNLAVIMGTYDPSPIKCGRAFKDAKSCGDLLSGMSASTDNEIFGPDGTFVQEVLPRTIESDDKKCVLKLFSGSDAPSVTSWYRIWEAAEATFAMCARFAQSGSYRELGIGGNIFMTLGGRSNSLGDNSSLVATS